MNKIQYGLCVGLMLAQTSVFGQVEKLIKQLHNARDRQVMVAAHRGDWRNAPENSLRACELAIAEGVDIVEVDLKMSKDGVLVILHDQTLNRSTTGKGKPSDLTLAQLKELRLRDGLGVMTAHRIPTLEEIMRLSKGKALVNLDHSTPYYREALAVLKRTGTLSQALFKSDEPYEKLRGRYGALLDSINFMPVVETSMVDGQATIQAYQKGMKPVAAELVFEQDTVTVFRKPPRGMRIWVNSLWPELCGGHDDALAVDSGNKEQSWAYLIAHGVNIIQTDRPRELLAYLRGRKLHK